MRRQLLFPFVFLLAQPMLVAGGPALAGNGPMKFEHRKKSPDAPPLRPIEYYCTDAEGKRHELGDVICITTSCYSQLARCGMSLNNPAWRKLQDGCPGASLHDPYELLDPAFDPAAIDPQISTPEAQPS